MLAKEFGISSTTKRVQDRSTINLAAAHKHGSFHNYVLIQFTYAFTVCVCVDEDTFVRIHTYVIHMLERRDLTMVDVQIE